MPINPTAQILEALTPRDVDVLREAATGKSQMEIAIALAVETKSVNKRVAALKLLTGEHSVGSLGQFWRDHRMRWFELQARRAGISPEEITTELG